MKNTNTETEKLIKNTILLNDTMNTFEKIYEVVKNIPKGKVATYGQVAILAGNSNWARVVGYALHNNPNPSIIPCHRVVNREGKTAKAFAFGGADIQRQLLENEGVLFGIDGRVDMEKCCIKLHSSIV